MTGMRRLVVLATFGLVVVAALGPAAPAALAPAVTASVAVDVSCFGPCGTFVADFARNNDGGLGAASASASYEGVHAQAHASANEGTGGLAVDATGSLHVPVGAAGNVNMTPIARIDDTITLSAPATLTVHGTITADIASDSPSDYVLGKVLFAGEEAVTEEYDGTAAGTRPFSALVALPAGTSDFRAELTAHIDLRPSDGQSLAATVKPSTMTFTIDVPDGITVSSGSGRLPLSPGGPSPPSLSITDVAKAEGESGTTPFSFDVTLSGASASPVTVHYATADGTATAPDDYAAASGTLTFAPSDIAKTVTIEVQGDTAPEADETFVVRLTNATGASIADDSGAATIRDDDSGPPPPPAKACITVSPAATIDFGTGMLSKPGAVVSLAGNQSITVTNCGTQTEAIVVRGTSAGASGTTWDLTEGDPCAAGPGKFGLALSIGELSLRVGTANKTVGTLEPGQTVTRKPRILMACSGSSGAGQTLTTQLIFLATA
jgi:fibronectin-binding autotransporter adhesin